MYILRGITMKNVQASLGLFSWSVTGWLNVGMLLKDDGWRFSSLSVLYRERNH